jgi:hypothetical protein
MQGSPQFHTDMNLCFYTWWYSSYLPVLFQTEWSAPFTPRYPWQTGIFLLVIMYDPKFNLCMYSPDITWYHSYGPELDEFSSSIFHLSLSWKYTIPIHHQCVCVSVLSGSTSFSPWNKKKEEEKRIRLSFQQRTAIPVKPIRRRQE